MVNGDWGSSDWGTVILKAAMGTASSIGDTASIRLQSPELRVE
jgi:hypothetical protein